MHWEARITKFNALSNNEPDIVISVGYSLLKDLPGTVSENTRGDIWFRIALAQIQIPAYDAAERALNEARRLHEEANDRTGALRDALGFGILYLFLGQQDLAYEAFYTTRVEAAREELQEIEEAAFCNLGRTCIELGRYGEAVEFLQAGLAITDRTKNKNHQSAILHELGRVALAQGQVDQAVELLEEGSRLAKDANGAFGYEYAASLSQAYLRTQRWEEADVLVRDTLESCRTGNLRHGIIQLSLCAGDLAIALDNTQKALSHWVECFRIADEIRQPQFRIYSATRLADYHKSVGQYQKAYKYQAAVLEEERNIRQSRIHHIITAHQQRLRIDYLEEEMRTWRRRSGELEQIRNTKEQWIRELELIKDIGQEITASLDDAFIVEVLYNRLSEILDIKFMTIGLFVDGADFLDVRYVLQRGQRKSGQKVPLQANQSLSAWCLHHKRDLVIRELDKEMHLYAENVPSLNHDEPRSQSLMFVRLMLEGKAFGIMSVQTEAAGAYTTEQLKILQTMAGFVAIALSNSHVHQDLVEANEKIAHMASHDPLTGLPNRKRILESLQEAIARAKRYNENLAVAFIDLDGFKSVNDNQGHRAGDALLVAMAKRLKEETRATDAVGRLGGDEFLVIFTDDCSPRRSVPLAEKILKRVADPIAFHNNSLTVTGSIGLSHYPDDGLTPDALVNAADEAMYRAKAQGKNRISTFQKTP